MNVSHVSWAVFHTHINKFLFSTKDFFGLCEFLKFTLVNLLNIIQRNSCYCSTGYMESTICGNKAAMF